MHGVPTSKCIGKEVATKYFLPGDLKLNLFWLGFPDYLDWCVDSCFCSEFIESKQKKEEERFLGGLKWELWLGNSMLGSLNSLQKQDTKINLHTNL